MNVRRSLLLAGGAAAVPVAVILLGRLGATDRACPAVGWGYVGDVELAFSVPPQSVAACFGDGCIPAPVTASAEGRWLVPQSPPYLTAPPVKVTLGEDAAGPGRGHRFDGGLPDRSFETPNRHGTVETGPGHRSNRRRATRGSPPLRCCQAAGTAR